MRALILIPLLALSACSGENNGWNPNYRAEATPYGDYLRARELALTGKQAEPPRTIPVALPAKAPTAREIAGPSPTQMLEQDTTQTAYAVGIARKPSTQRRGAPAVDPSPPGLYPMHGRGRTVAVVATPVATSPARAPGSIPPVTATPLPASGTALDRYAAASGHAPGTARYARDRSVSGNCAAWASPAAAQQAFLAQGGPQRDVLGIDPDGDGYVCGWTPAGHRAGGL